jgi:hypothetical protein
VVEEVLVAVGPAVRVLKAEQAALELADTFISLIFGIRPISEESLSPKTF